jgi:hypothetical protein
MGAPGGVLTVGRGAPEVVDPSSQGQIARKGRHLVRDPPGSGREHQHPLERVQADSEPKLAKREPTACRFGQRLAACVGGETDLGRGDDSVQELFAFDPCAKLIAARRYALLSRAPRPSGSSVAQAASRQRADTCSISRWSVADRPPIPPPASRYAARGRRSRRRADRAVPPRAPGHGRGRCSSSRPSAGRPAASPSGRRRARFPRARPPKGPAERRAVEDTCDRRRRRHLEKI